MTNLTQRPKVVQGFSTHSFRQGTPSQAPE